MLKNRLIIRTIVVSYGNYGKTIARAQEGKEIKNWKARVFLSTSHLCFSLCSNSSLFLCLLGFSKHLVGICFPMAVKSICSSHKQGLVVSEFQFQISRRKNVISSALGHMFTQFSSVTQSCPTLCDPVDYSTPGLPVHHQLPEFAQSHVH